MSVAGIARGLLAAFGWTVVLAPPGKPKAVVVFYPHTSNWDFVVGILARSALSLPAHFAGKDSLFRWPFGAVFRALGGIPVNRRERTGFVTQMAAEFARRDKFYLAIAPEGTRRLTSGWKSGFYRLALAAGVPLALAFIDYRKREIGIMGYLELCGDEAVDIGRLRGAYAGCSGRRPQMQGPIALLADKRDKT